MISVRSVKSVLPVFLLASAAVTSGAAAQTLSVAENTPDTENEPSKKNKRAKPVVSPKLLLLQQPAVQALLPLPKHARLFLNLRKPLPL